MTMLGVIGIIIEAIKQYSIHILNTDSINSGNTILSLFSSHEHVCDVSDLSSCAMTAGFTGHLNNLDYSVCVEQQYGFCGVEYSSADPTEIGPFSLSNKTKTNNGEEDEVGTGG